MIVRVVVVLAVAAALALLVAVLTASPWVAVLVVVLAAAGIVLLVRDWRGAARSAPGADTTDADQSPFTEYERPEALTADALSPDISTEPGGPSSDARAD